MAITVQHLARILDKFHTNEQTAEIDVPKREMLFIRDNLIAAESARRRGDTPTVYKAYNRYLQERTVKSRFVQKHLEALKNIYFEVFI